MVMNISTIRDKIYLKLGNTYSINNRVEIIQKLIKNVVFLFDFWSDRLEIFLLDCFHIICIGVSRNPSSCIGSGELMEGWKVCLMRGGIWLI